MVGLIALAGGLGAVVRFVLDGWIRGRTHPSSPWGIAGINISGSLALGLVAGLVTRQLLPEPLYAVFGVGFLGGYTTFSTASLETVWLLQQGHWTRGTAYALGTAVMAVVAAGLGWVVGGVG